MRGLPRWAQQPRQTVATRIHRHFIAAEMQADFGVYARARASERKTKIDGLHGDGWHAKRWLSTGSLCLCR